MTFVSARVSTARRIAASAAALAVVVSMSVVAAAPTAADTSAGGANIHFAPDDKLLATGETYTAPIEVTTPVTPPDVDLVFLVDATSSMDQEIIWLSNQIQDVVDQLIAQGAGGSGIRIGLASYEEITGNVSKYGPFNWWMPLANYTSAEVSAQMKIIAGALGSGGLDVPEDGLNGLLRTIGETPWRTGAAHHIMVVTDAPMKIRPTVNVPINGTNYPVTVASLTTALGLKDITLSLHGANVPAADLTVSNTTTIGLTRLATAVGARATWDNATNESALHDNLLYTVAETSNPYGIVPSVSCVYASDGVVSGDVAVGFAPGSLNVDGAGKWTIAETASTVEPPVRVGDRRTGSPLLEETVCTVYVSVNGDRSVTGQTIRWDPYRALAPIEDTAPERVTVYQGQSATLHLTAHAPDPGVVSYQWFSNTVDSTTGGTLISGAVGASYSPPVSEVLGTTFYYVVMVNTLTGAYYPTAESTSSVGAVTVVRRPAAVAVKSVVPSSSSAVLPGGFLDYVLTFSAGGASEARLDVTDDLSGVLDDAVLVAGPSTTASGVTVSPVGADGVFSVTGMVYAGVDVSVTYRVQVNAGVSGDNSVVNVLRCDPLAQGCTAQTTINPVARLSFVHTIVPRSGSALVAGSVVDLVYTVTNTGAAPLSGLAVVWETFTGSAVLGAATCPTRSLAPGESVTCTAPYGLTQRDVDHGGISSSAHSTGLTALGAAGEPVLTAASNTDSASVPVAGAPGLTLSKVVTGLDPVSPLVGQVLTYSFTVTNTGNVTVSNVGIVEDAFSGSPAVSVTCPDTTTTPLAPSGSVTCTGTYTVTQADVDDGGIANLAHATGNPSSGGAIVSGWAGAAVTLPQTPGLTLSKSASVTSPDEFTVGRGVTYSFLVTNSGNVTIHDLVVDELSFTGAGSLSAVTCPVTLLAPGATTTCTATYTINQADVDAAIITNSAQARGYGPASGGVPVGAEVTSAPSSATISGARNPSLSLSKTVTVPNAGLPLLGQSLTYSFAVTNTGNVTVTDLSISEVDFSGSPALSVTCPVTSLAPGASTTCTAPYSVRQSDIDAGGIGNTARAVAVAAGGSSVTSPESGATVPLPGAAVLTVHKSDSPSLSSPARPGDVIDYVITVTNTGTRTASSVTLTDVLVGSTYGTVTWPAGRPAGTLAPGESVVYTASYAITQSDVDAKSVTNRAVATGTGTHGEVLTAEDEVATWLGDGLLQLTVVKAADASGVTTPWAQVGDPVNYSLTITNTGSLTVTDVDLDDILASPADLSWGWAGLTAGTLSPGQSVVVTFTYLVTQPDIEAGHVLNSAYASGTGPGSLPVRADSNQTDTALAGGPVLELAKTATPSWAAGTRPVAGDQIAYSITATNTGTRTVFDVVLTDPLVSDVFTAVSWDGTPGVLTPGQGVQATAVHVVTASDLEVGLVTNVAEVAGHDLEGQPVGDTDTVSTDTRGWPVLEITKLADLTGLSVPPLAGEVIDYTITVTNTGTRSARWVEFHDPLLGDVFTSVTWPTGPVGQLRPGESVVVTGEYAPTQADIDAGFVTNQANASGKDPDDVPVGPVEAEVTTPLDGAVILDVVKTDTPRLSVPAQAGDQIDYTVTVRNLGNQTASSINLTDVLVGSTYTSVTWPTGGAPGVLAPGQSAAFEATYTTTQADIDAASVTNLAVADAVGPDGTPATASDQVTTGLAGLAELTVEKAADSSGLTLPWAQVGDPIDYTLTISNTGTLTVTDIDLDDVLATPADLTWHWGTGLTAGTLTPGQSVDVTFTYPIVQSDIETGHVLNYASASGTAPSSTPVQAVSNQTDTPILGGPVVEIVKTATPSWPAGTRPVVGDSIAYTITVTNSGTRTVFDVVVTDALVADTFATETWDGTVGVLLPSETATFTAIHLITASDLEVGLVTNTAAVTGHDLEDAEVADADTVTTDTRGLPVLEVTKTADLTALSAPPQAGEMIGYTITVTNTGTRSAQDVVLSDELLEDVFTSVTWPGLEGLLWPGESAIWTGEYLLTQADLDAGEIVNLASADGFDPDDVPVGPVEGEVTSALDQVASLEVIKQADGSAVSLPPSPGQVVAYSFTVTNTGNQTVAEVGVVDQLEGLSDVVFDEWPGEVDGVLLPGQSVLAHASYPITQSDIDAGHVTNEAVAIGVAGTIAVESEQDDTDTGFTPQITYTLVKTADDEQVHLPALVGDVITFTLTATNTGSSTIHDVAIVDPMKGLSPLVYGPWPGTPGALAPGQSITATATYALTQADIEAGHVSNQASLTGTGPDQNPLPAQVDDTDTPVQPPRPAGTPSPLPTTPAPSPPLAFTGLERTQLTIGAGGGLLACLGGMLMLVGYIRRNRQQT